jgi:Domain of unknown function (DUF4386)
MPSNRRLAAVLMVIAVVLANVAFLGLGSVFNYPDILQESASAILAEFREDQGTIITLFVVLAISAALLAPIAVLVGRLAPNKLGRWSIGVGIAAAVVQVIGLLRWPLVVPFLADREETDAFETVHTALGTIVGETLGYLLTATWTVLIIYALGKRLAGRWFTYLGLVAAALIAVGVFVPLDLPGADFANFVGYILWSIWLVAFAVLIWRQSQVERPATPQLAT